MDPNQHRTGTDVLESLAGIAFETDEFPTSAEAMEILKEEGLDSERIKQWTLEKIRGVRARQKLAAARQKRIQWEDALNRCIQRSRGVGSAIRESVLSKLKVLSESDPEAAQVYCRKFESMSDEDLPELEAELSLLDSLAEDDGDDG